MAMFDNLKDTFNKSVAAVSVKSETLVESSRVKSAISSSQKSMDAELNAMGIKLYQCWKAGQADIELFTEDFARVKAIEDEIANLRARLDQIKAEEDKILGASRPVSPYAAGGPAVYCPRCGKALPAGSRFCDDCGAPLA